MKKLLIISLCFTFLNCNNIDKKTTKTSVPSIKNEKIIDATGKYGNDGMFRGTVKEVSYDHYTNEKYFVESKGIFKVDKNNYGKISSLKLYTGDCIGYDTDNKIVFKGKYLNGKRDGEWLEYYKDGTLEFIWNFKNDKLHNEHIRYYENGNIMFVGHYKDGVLHGDYIHYYDNGSIKSFETFNNGKMVGETITYEKDGNI